MWKFGDEAFASNAGKGGIVPCFGSQECLGQSPNEQWEQSRGNSR